MIKPAGHRLVIKPDVLEEVDPVYASAKRMGIQIAKSDDERKREQAGIDKGTVVSIGQTAFKDFGGEPWCNVGDYVAYARYAGKYMKDEVDDVEYIILNDEDIVAILKEGTKA